MAKPNQNEFDLRVHFRDGRTRQIVRKQPYRAVCKDMLTFFERPVGSAKFYYRNGKPVSAHDYQKYNLAKYKIERVETKSADQVLREENDSLAKKNAELEKQLDALLAQHGDKAPADALKEAQAELKQNLRQKARKDVIPTGDFGPDKPLVEPKAAETPAGFFSPAPQQKQMA